MREAFFPRVVMDGAINPITISGTQKLMISPRICFKDTMTFMNAMETGASG